jgi:ABC transport system ATP-binding/permease protein
MTSSAFQLVIQVTGEPPRAHELTGEHLQLGRAPDNDIQLTAPFVSRYLAELHWTGSGYRLQSVPSATPLVFRGRPVTGDIDLTPGDFFRVVGPNAGEMLTLAYATSEETAGPTEGVLPLDPHAKICIGSGPGNDLGSGDPAIDPDHAEIGYVDGQLRIVTLGQGITEVNNMVISGAVSLGPGDTIRIGGLRLRVTADGKGPEPPRLEYRDTAEQWLIGRRRARSVPEDLLSRMEGTGGVLIEALHLHRRVGHRGHSGRRDIDLLRDISLRIRPRELVVVVGLSGAGKTTLLDALAGYHPASNGQVLVDGAELYEHFDCFRSGIGFVPQRDIIHRDLTVYEALDYSARLRLPPETTEEERHRRIEEVMAELDLGQRRDLQVRALSGGQQKRVSIGVELITSPQLFFLDEPTSGLDPGTETGLMQLLRHLADQGRTVILTTHATKNVMLADKVIFMARGGYVAWYGPPTEALAYFNQQRPERERENADLAFDAIYSMMDDPIRGTPEEWAQRYRVDAAYEKYIAAPLRLDQRPVADQRPPPSPPPEPPRQVSSLRQFLILSGRNLKLLTRDHIALALMLLATPVLAMLDFFLTSRHMYDPTLGDSLKATIGAATLSINGVFVGALSQTREIIKDSDIYWRERKVNLKIAPYVLSKVWLAAVLALYQAAVWVGIRYLAVQMPGGIHLALGIYVTVLLTVLAGMMLGLFASAVAPTEQSVTMIVALLIVPQILFSGSFMPLPKLTPVGQALSAAMTSRWSFEAIMTQSQMGKDLGEDPGWQLLAAKRQTLTDAQKQRDRCLGIHIFTQCTFPGIRSYYRPTVNAPPPSRPRQPAHGASPAEQAQYQKQLMRYQRAYATWQAGRSGPIAAAEAVLGEENDKFGGTYNVNVALHWIILAGISLLLIASILVIQKAKDHM